MLLHSDKTNGWEGGEYWSSDERLDYPFQIKYNYAHHVGKLFGEREYTYEGTSFKNIRYKVRAVRTSYFYFNNLNL